MNEYTGPRYDVPAGDPGRPCKGCGRTIHWVKTPAGKWMPVEWDGTPAKLILAAAEAERDALAKRVREYEATRANLEACKAEGFMLDGDAATEDYLLAVEEVLCSMPAALTPPEAQGREKKLPTWEGWPCIHGPSCDGRGIDCGPDTWWRHTRREEADRRATGEPAAEEGKP